MVLCCLLPFSGLDYAKAIYHASVEFFFSGLSDAITYWEEVWKPTRVGNMVQWMKSQTVTSPLSMMQLLNDPVIMRLLWKSVVYGSHEMREL